MYRVYHLTDKEKDMNGCGQQFAAVNKERKIMKENKLEEMKTLIEELHVASSAYYNKQPIMQNFEYDLKCKQLIALEKETGITYPDSPTLIVGAAIEKQSSL